MVSLRRGFKKEGNDIARQLRRELRIGLTSRLDPWALAEHLEITVVPLSLLRRETPRAVRYFSQVNESEFSALTVFCGSERLIVYNDAHHIGRQASDIAHELAHALLLHTPVPALNADGNRQWDKTMEEEAQWLSGALLISEEAALYIVRQGLTDDQASQRYGVTPKMVAWRIGVTGARARVARSSQYYRQRA